MDSPTQITATVPAGAASGTVAVTTPGGIATSVASFTVTSSPTPTLGGFTPDSGPVGTSVTLTGVGLTGATVVRFNGTAAVFSVDSATQITAMVPVGATSGTIAVTTPGGVTTSVVTFTVIPAPSIASFTPASALVGASVTITGIEFTGATAVAFSGTAAAFSVDSPTQITATVPVGATSGTVAVTTPGGIATSVASFTVTARSNGTLKLSGLKSGAVALGKNVMASGKVTPVSLAGSKVKLTAQRKKSGKWVTAKTVSAIIRIHWGLQLEVQARPDGHLSHAGGDHEDSGAHRRHDRVADVQSEVARGDRSRVRCGRRRRCSLAEGGRLALCVGRQLGGRHALHGRYPCDCAFWRLIGIRLLAT